MSVVQEVQRTQKGRHGDKDKDQTPQLTLHLITKPMEEKGPGGSTNDGQDADKRHVMVRLESKRDRGVCHATDQNQKPAQNGTGDPKPLGNFLEAYLVDQASQEKEDQAYNKYGDPIRTTEIVNPVTSREEDTSDEEGPQIPCHHRKGNLVFYRLLFLHENSPRS